MTSSRCSMDGPREATLRNPHLVKLAEGFGTAGTRVRTSEALKQEPERALGHDAPAPIELPLDPGAEALPWQFLLPAPRAESLEATGLTARTGCATVGQLDLRTQVAYKSGEKLHATSHSRDPRSLTGGGSHDQ